MTIKKKLKGTGVAIVTPFRKDSSIDFLSLQKLLDHVLNNGVNYLVVLGTTGETATLNSNEKKAVLNFVIDTVEKKVPIVAGFGGNNTGEIVSNIKHNNLSGIDAILSVSPYYNKPSQKGLYNHYKAIANASSLPIILYNVPGRTSVNISAETTVQLANDFENIVALKDASGNFEQNMKILKNKPDDFMLISGDDLLTLPLISMGAHGVISVTANAFPKEYSTLVNCALAGKFKEAMKLQKSLLDIILAIFEEGNPAGVKAALRILDIAQNYLRQPLEPISKASYNKLSKLIKQTQE
ncbi:MAG: 4-hydroxy-tetrahydrodipicolinate synthase [Bacteroidetes bacterium 4572_117]|nr:MAG: 4-hydroxy-tetrahydrodipicolinate synthase [Bacteroidetes bacterium 4572_117]